MWRLLIAAALSCGALLTAAAPAAAQAENDPEADSPSGHVYAIPVETARGDAAPRRSSPRRGGSGAPSRDDASGAGSGAGAASPAPEQQESEEQAGSEGGEKTTSAIRSENGFGSSSRVPGVATPRETDRAEPTPRAASVAPASESDPSGLRVFGLLALGVVLAAGVGVVSRAGRRRA